MSADACVCCGLHGYEQGECGHWFCEICVNRDHDVDCLVCEGQASAAVPDSLGPPCPETDR